MECRLMQVSQTGFWPPRQPHCSGRRWLYNYCC